MIAQLNRKKGQTLRQSSGQSTVEYAVLIIVIIAALAVTQNYVKRGIQGKLKDSADNIGDQYSPGNTNVIVAEKVHSHQKQLFGVTEAGDYSQGNAKTIIDNEITNSITRSVVVNDSKENYGGN